MNKYRSVAAILLTCGGIWLIIMFGWAVIWTIKFVFAMVLLIIGLVGVMLILVTFLAIVSAPFYFMWDYVTKKIKKT